MQIFRHYAHQNIEQANQALTLRDDGQNTRRVIGAPSGWTPLNPNSPFQERAKSIVNAFVTNCPHLHVYFFRPVAGESSPNALSLQPTKTTRLLISAITDELALQPVELAKVRLTKSNLKTLVNGEETSKVAHQLELHTVRNHNPMGHAYDEINLIDNNSPGATAYQEDQAMAGMPYKKQKTA